MTDNIGEFTRQLLRFAEGKDVSKLVVVSAFVLTTVVGFVLGLFRARALRRLQAAAAAYAEREMAQRRRLHEPSSVRPVSQPDDACCFVSGIDQTFRTRRVELNEIRAWLPSRSKA
jgi:hypothetical protein